MGERVSVGQCVTSGKLLSVDLHNTVFPLSPDRKTSPFCKTTKGQNKADGSTAPEGLGGGKVAGGGNCRGAHMAC